MIPMRVLSNQPMHFSSMIMQQVHRSVTGAIGGMGDLTKCRQEEDKVTVVTVDNCNN